MSNGILYFFDSAKRQVRWFEFTNENIELNRIKLTFFSSTARSAEELL